MSQPSVTFIATDYRHKLPAEQSHTLVLGETAPVMSNYSDEEPLCTVTFESLARSKGVVLGVHGLWPGAQPGRLTSPNMYLNDTLAIQDAGGTVMELTVTAIEMEDWPVQYATQVSDPVPQP